MIIKTNICELYEYFTQSLLSRLFITIGSFLYDPTKEKHLINFAKYKIKNNFKNSEIPVSKYYFAIFDDNFVVRTSHQEVLDNMLALRYNFVFQTVKMNVASIHAIVFVNDANIEIWIINYLHLCEDFLDMTSCSFLEV